MRNILSIIAIIVFYLFVNFVLWGSQELYHWKDLTRINELEKIIEQKEALATECDVQLIIFTNITYHIKIPLISNKPIYL